MTRALEAALAAGGIPAMAGKNLLINGGFRINQRDYGASGSQGAFTSTSSPANNDGAYLLDRWVLLSEGGNDTCDVYQEQSTVPTQGRFAIKLEVETANRQFGILQIIEVKNCRRLASGVASLSFKASKGGSNATVDHLRAGVLAWSSTEDVVTRDAVGTWNAEGADPTLATNWAFCNTPSDLTLTTSYQTFKIENITIPAASSAINLAVFIWVDNDDGTVNDTVFISDVQLEAGSKATEVEYIDMATEQARCDRYYRRYVGNPPSYSRQMLMGCNYVSGTSAAYTTPVAREQSFRITPTLAAVGTVTLAYSNGAGDITATLSSASYINDHQGSNFTWSSLGITLVEGVIYWVRNFEASAEL